MMRLQLRKDHRLMMELMETNTTVKFKDIRENTFNVYGEVLPSPALYEIHITSSNRSMGSLCDLKQGDKLNMNIYGMYTINLKSKRMFLDREVTFLNLDFICARNHMEWSLKLMLLK